MASQTSDRPEGDASHEGSNPPTEEPGARAAAKAVFSTTELLEQILSHLVVEELFYLRRVSRHWRDVMNRSLILQRAMFLAPEPESNFESHLQPHRRGRGSHHGCTRNSCGTAPSRGHTTMRSARYNALLFERERLSLEQRGDYDAQQSARLYPTSTFVKGRDREIFAQMLVAQPPVAHARVGCRTRVVNESGIKARDIREAMQEQRAVKQFPRDQLGKHKEDDMGRHFASFVVEDTMFPSREEETEGKTTRHIGFGSGHCTNRFRKEKLVVGSDSPRSTL